MDIFGQSVESHLNFAVKYSLNYTLLSNTGERVRKLYGVPSDGLGMIPGRVTYLTDKEGKAIYIINPQLQAERHVDEALKIILLLKKADIGED